MGGGRRSPQKPGISLAGRLVGSICRKSLRCLVHMSDWIMLDLCCALSHFYFWGVSTVHLSQILVVSFSFVLIWFQTTLKRMSRTSFEETTMSSSPQSVPRLRARHNAIQSAPAESQPLRMSHLRQLRIMLDELEVKLDARNCLHRNGRERYARRIQVEDEFNEFLQSVNDLVASHLGSAETTGGTVVPTSSTTTDDGFVRIQLKLSHALVKVLQVVRQEHVKASTLVEEVLWSSPRVRDTARLAGILQPKRKPAA